MTQNTAHDRISVGILFGGRSSEHSISLITARGVLGVLDREKYEPVLIGITRRGTWHLSDPEELERLTASEALPEFPGNGTEVYLPLGRPGEGIQVRDADGAVAPGPHLDVVFPLLHGPFGEDGTVQGLLELADLRYVGGGVTASAVGMDKHFMKIAFEAAGLAVGPYTTVTARDWAHGREAAVARIQELGLPVFVKPARAGSSMGITRVDDWADLDAAVAEAQRHDPKLVVEAGIEGREIECAVLDAPDLGMPQASDPGEIEVLDEEIGWYDFEAKYVASTASRTRCPADLPEEVSAEIRREAVKAFLALDCEGLARADFFWAADGRVVINEVNTMPGFTPISMYRVMWEESGVPYAELVDRLLRLALARPTGLR